MRGCLVGEQKKVKKFANRLLNVPRGRLDISGERAEINAVLLVDTAWGFLENGITVEDLPLAIYVSLFGVLDNPLLDISAWVEFDTPAWECLMVATYGSRCVYKSFNDLCALLTCRVYRVITDNRELLAKLPATEVYIEEYSYFGADESPDTIENMYEYLSLYEDIASMYRINLDALESYSKFFTKQVEKYPMYVNFGSEKPYGIYHMARVGKLQEQLGQFRG